MFLKTNTVELKSYELKTILKTRFVCTLNSITIDAAALELHI